MQSKRSFTLVELVTVLAIIGVSMGLFYSVFFLNWVSFIKETVLNDLVLEMDRVLETLSLDVKMAERLEVLDNNNFILTLPNNHRIEYRLLPEGIIQRNGQNLAEFLNPEHSFFQVMGRSLVVELLFEDDVLGQRIQLPARTQIFLRNQ
jgi:prepilin-type N-terminal cleavage/methylation domain-containing protein